MSILTESDYVAGDSSANVINGDAGAEIIQGLGGGDTIFGGGGDDTLIGGVGADVLTGDGGADVLYGGAGADVLIWDASLETDPGDVDRLWGEDGNDTLVLNFSSADYTTAVADEIAAFAAALAAGQDPGAGGEYTFTTFQLSVLGIENVLLFIDDSPISPGTPPAGTAVNDAFQVDDNASLSGDVTANDGFDPQTQSIVLLQDVANGSLELGAAGGFSFATGEAFLSLSEGETATETFTYAIFAGQAQLSTATVTITINGVNDAPSALDIEAGTDEDTPLSLNLIDRSLASDVDASDTLSITAIDGQAVAGPNTSITLASGAVVTVSPDGAFTYDPEGAFDFLGVEEGALDTVSFTVSDDKGASVVQVLRIGVDGINDPPVAVGDSATASEGASVTIDVLANDFDPDSANIDIDSFDAAGTNGGTITRADVGLLFDPNGDFENLSEGDVAVTTFQYVVDDRDGGQSVGEVTVTITGENDGPQAAGVSATTDEDTAFSLNLLVESDASDVDQNDILTLAAIDGVSIDGPGTVVALQGGGVITASPDGTIAFDPAGDFDALDVEQSASLTISFTITDDKGATVTRTLSIDVTGENDAPVALDDAATTDEDTAIEIDVLANDSDPDDAPSISAFDEGADIGGSVSLGQTGLIFDPAGDFDFLAEGESVDASFSYTLTDNEGATSVATVTVTVTGVNDDPTGEQVSLSTDEDSALSFSLLDESGASDLDETDTLTVVSVNGVDLGGQATEVDSDLFIPFTVSPDGTVSYDPAGFFDFLDEDESLTDSFTFTISDDFGATFQQVALIEILGVNDAPVAVDDAVVAAPDDVIDIDVLANDSDPDDPLTITAFDATGDAGGVITQSAGGLLFDPNGEFDFLADGESAETRFTYTITDDDGATSTATVTVRIAGGNEAPTGDPVALSTDEDNALGFNLIDASNASDPDTGDTLTVIAVNGGAIIGTTAIVTAASGVVTVSPDGTVTYDPAGAFEFLDTGETVDDSFTFTIADAAGAIFTETVTITITGVNDAPVAADDAGATDEDTAVEIDLLANDTDPDDDVSIAGFDNVGDNGGIIDVVEGVATFDPNGEFDFLAEGDQIESAFTYTITDDDGEQSTATVTVAITGVNDDPTAVDVTQATDEDTAFGFNLLDESGAEDVDEGDALTILSVDGVALNGAAATITTVNGGTLTVSPDGTVSYDPAGAFETLGSDESAEDSFTFTIADAFGGTVQRSATITIAGVNDAPVAQDDAATTDEDTAVLIDVGANDSDIDSATLTYAIPENAGVFGFADAVVAYTGGGDPSSALGAGDGVFVSLPTGQSVTLAFLDETITDGAGDDLFIGEIGPGGEFANIEISSDGQNFTFLGVASNDTVSSFDIGAVGFTGELRFVRITGLDNGGSSPGFDLDFVQAIGEAVDGLRGDVTDLGGGVLSYDPGADFDFLADGDTATETFSYVVSDDDGASDVGQVTVTIAGVNDDPTAADVSQSTDEDTAFGFNLLDASGAADVDQGDALTILSVDGVALNGAAATITTANGGSLSVSPDGTVSYDPAGAFETLDNGESAEDGFSFTITDASGGTVQRSATITIAGVNDAPVAQDDAATTDEDTAVEIDVLGNDTDPDDPLAISEFDAAGDNGGVIDSLGEALLFDPNGDFDALGEGESAETSFSYTIADDDGEQSTATVTVTVEGVNDAPTGTGAALSTDEDTALAGNLITGAEADVADVDANDTLSVVRVAGAALVGSATVRFDSGAAATILADGSVSFDPAGFYDALAEGETATERFTYVVADEAGAETAQLTATLTITGVNDAPVGQNIQLSTTEDDPVRGNLLDGAFDPEGDGFGLVSIEGQSLQDDGVAVTLASGARVAAGIAASFTYDPNGAFESLASGETATDSFSYTLRDEFGAEATYVVTVTVDGVDDAAAFGGTAATAITLVSVTGDGAASGDGASITPQISADGASVVFTSNATNLVTPDANETVGDVLLADLEAGTIEQANLIDGTNDQSVAATTSVGAVDGLAGGRYVVFHSGADDLSADDANGRTDVYVRDLDTGATELISVSIEGVAGNGDSLNASISADGRYVAFQSTATDLVENDQNETTADVYLRDRVTGETIKISSPEGGNNRFSSFNARISEDGSTVVFATFGALVDEDQNGTTDIYAYDVAAKTLELVSLGNGGVLGNGGAQEASVSANGRYVYFASAADNLVAGDTNGLTDGFVYDRVTGVTERVNVSTSGAEADARLGFGVDFGQISADGRYVIFASEATNLDEITPDTNGAKDVFLRDRLTGETVRLSVTLDRLGEAGGFMPSISADGARAAFSSFDTPDPLDARGVDNFEDVYVVDIDINGAAVETDDGTVTVDLLDGYTDAEGDDLNISGVAIASDNGRSVSFSVNAEAGTITFDAAQFEDNAPGDYELLTISYSVDGEDGLSVDATAGVSVLRSIVTAGAVNDSFATDEDTTLSDSVALNDDPVAGGIYSLVSGLGQGEGFLTFNTDGSFTYRPQSGFNDLTDGETAQVSFTYELDVAGVTSQATATIDVSGVNDRPAYFVGGSQSFSLVSVAANGFEGAEADAFRPDISGDGSLIAFESTAGNFLDGDNNGLSDVFIGTGIDGMPITRESLIDGATEGSATGDSAAASVSDDGAVAFQSSSPDLTDVSTSGQTDIYVREGASTEIISLNFAGEPANGDSFGPSISDDGRYVAFTSTATNLVQFSGDDNGAGLDVFVYDRFTGEMISVTQDSDRSDTGASFAPTISGDGTRVVFLTENSYSDIDDNGLVDVYAYDLRTGEYFYASHSVDFTASDGDAYLSDEADIDLTSRPTISDNGRYVAYVSQAENLTFDDQNGLADVFLYDIDFDENEIISLNVNLEQGNDVSYAPAISGDGRFIAYETLATNLDLLLFNGDTNDGPDILVYDQAEFDTVRVTFGSDAGGSQPTISDDGSRVAFVSDDSGSYDFRIGTTGVQNVYVADMRVNGITVDDNAGSLFVDLGKDIIDPEGDRLFFDNIFVFTDNLNRVSIDYTVPTDGDGVPLSGILIDFSQFDDLGVGDYELVTVNSTVADALDGQVDGAGNFAIVIKGANDDPVAVDESFVVNPGASFSGTVTATDIDGTASGFEQDVDVLSFSADASGFPGTFSLSPDGSFIADIDPDASGIFTIDVLVSDPYGGSDTATLTFTVNGAPEFSAFETPLSVAIGDTASIDVGAAFSDPEGGGLTFSAGRVGGGGLPGGLSIDPVTGVISGTVTDPGGNDLTRIFVTATDELGGATTVENWLTITDNIVTGTDGGDVLTALTNPDLDGQQSNLIVGGLGDDLLNGFDERDIYIWRAGDGFDLIQDDGSGDTDRVIITGVSADDIVLSRFGADEDDLLFEVRGTEGQFTSGFIFRNGLAANFSAQLDQILLDDGTIIDLDEIRARVAAADVAAGGATVLGTASAETLTGFDGATLIGDRGVDAYLYNPGDGRVTIDESTGSSNGDEIIFGFDLLDGDGALLPEVRRIPGTTDLVIDFGGGDILTVVTVLEDGGGRIGAWTFNDGSVGTGFFRNAVLEAEATDGDDILLGFDGPNIADVLAGGLGDDYLAGSDGADVYNYFAGDGNDTIEDTLIDANVLNVNGFDLILDSDGLVDAASEVTFRRVSRDSTADQAVDDLLIEFDGAAGTGSITIFDQLDLRPLGAIQTLNFDGPNANVSLDIGALRRQIIEQSQTDGDDTVMGFDQSQDRLEGGAGDDLLMGGDATDIYVYEAGDGADTILDDGGADEDLLQVNGFDLIFDPATGLVDAASEVRFSQPAGSGSDLKISLDNGSEQGAIIVERFFDFVNQFLIENLEFTGDAGATSIRFDAIYNELLQSQATAGDDIISSPVNNNFNETIASGTGDDYVALGGGDDTYVYAAGDGRLRINELNFGGNGDALTISGYDFADLDFDLMPVFLFGSGTSYDLRIRPTAGSATGDEIIIRDGFNQNGAIGIETFVDGSGATLTKSEITALVISQALAAGDPLVYGTNQNAPDSFDSSIGADVTIVGQGSPGTYAFTAGDGWDTYREENFGGSDTVNLVGYSSADIGSTITFQTNNYRPGDVWIDFGGGDRLYLVNYGNFETINFTGDGASFNQAAFDALVQTNASVVTEIDGAGDFTFNSTAADERLLGQDGNDQANFTIGSIGHDLISQPFNGKVDITINLGATGEVSIARGQYRNGIDLVISVFESGATRLEDMETIRIEDLESLTGPAINTLTLITDAGTTVLTGDEVRQVATNNYVTDGDDAVYGFSSGETISGGAGDDILRGFGGPGVGQDDPDIYQFTVGAGGTGGDGRDLIFDDAFGDGDRIELISGDGAGSAAFENASIYFSPEAANDIIIDFGSDELRIVNLGRLSLADRFQQIVFDSGGAQQQIFNDRELVDIAIANQVTAGDDEIRGINNDSNADTNRGDTLNGGAGDDFLNGQGGPQGDPLDPTIPDIYLFEVGAGGAGGGGRDTIFDGAFGDTDVVRLISNGTTNGVGSAAFENATLRRNAAEPNALVIDFGEDELTIRDMFNSGIGANYDRITFDFGGANEQAFAKEALIAAFIEGSATVGDDEIQGTYLDDVLRGGLGDDTLTGDTGSDTYVFTPGQGDDVMLDPGGNGNFATVVVEADFADVEFFKRGSDGEDLLIRFNDGGSALILDAFLTSNSRGEIDALVFDDVSFTPEEVQALALAADLGRGAARLVSDNFDDVERAIDIDGDGTPDITVGAFRGTATNEFMSGRDGADTYIYTVGDGSHDVIHDQSTATGDDRLVIDGALPGDVIFERPAGDANDDDDLVIRFRDAQGSIRVLNTLDQNVRDNIERFVFNGVDDGGAPATVELTLNDVRDRISAEAATTRNDRINGFDDFDDTLSNGGGDPAKAGGDDFFQGLTGGDTYLFVDDAAVTQRMFVKDQGSAAGEDRLEVQGYAASDVTVRRLAAGSSDLLFTFAGAADQIIVHNTAAGAAADAIETFVFDGESFALDAVVAAADGDGSLGGVNVGGGAPLIGGLMTNTLGGDTGSDEPSDPAPTGDPVAETGGGATEDNAIPAGTAAADRLFGAGAAEAIAGFGGDDLIVGRAGADTLRGGAGADTLNGGGAADMLLGGGGADVLRGGGGHDVARGHGGADRLFGNRGDDRLSGGGASDTLNGGAGDDRLLGQKGGDLLRGGGGDDALIGGAGRDRLVGGAGDDTLAGGAGPDHFVFARGFGRDLVKDFGRGGDHLDFRGHSGVSSFADLDIRTLNGDAVIRDGLGGVLRLDGVDGDDLDASDFLF